jgi:hypothetical protein
MAHPPRLARDFPWLPREWSGKPIVDIINPVAAGAPWWLAGGVNPAAVLGAYQPKGAENGIAALINVANPGTNDLVGNGGPGPTWSAGNGLIFTRTSANVGQGLRTPFLSTALGNTPAILIRYAGITDAVTGTNYLTGISSNTRQAYSAYMIARSTAAFCAAGSVTPDPTPYGASTSGVLGLRVNAGIAELWMNGALYSSAACSYNSTRANYLGIGSQYSVFSSAYVNFLTGTIPALTYMTAATEAQMAAISAAMAAL